MRITLDQTIQYNNNKPTMHSTKSYQQVDNSDFVRTQSSTFSNLSAANFPNINFGMKADARFLLQQTNWLRCAYSGREMLAPDEARTIYKKLQKRPNAMSACNFLSQYQKYMHDIESRVFDIFQNSSHKNKCDFQDILKELQPAALARLKEKQENILSSTDKIIEALSPEAKEQVYGIKQRTYDSIENDTFTRRAPLKCIREVKGTKADKEKLEQIYRAWYKLPISAKDLDAFIVKYAKRQHNFIAQRLLSPSVATIEHIRPDSQGGDDNLANYLLVSAGFNNARDSMPLDEYIRLNNDIDIPQNLQGYMNSIIAETHKQKSRFADTSWYPDAIRRAIYAQTRQTLDLDTTALRLTKSQIRENKYSDRLATKYTMKAYKY
jgi:hypothetical protein